MKPPASRQGTARTQRPQARHECFSCLQGHHWGSLPGMVLGHAVGDQTVCGEGVGAES